MTDSLVNLLDTPSCAGIYIETSWVYNINLMRGYWLVQLFTSRRRPIRWTTSHLTAGQQSCAIDINIRAEITYSYMWKMSNQRKWISKKEMWLLIFIQYCEWFFFFYLITKHRNRWLLPFHNLSWLKWLTDWMNEWTNEWMYEDLSKTIGGKKSSTQLCWFFKTVEFLLLHNIEPNPVQPLAWWLHCARTFAQVIWTCFLTFVTRLNPIKQNVHLQVCSAGECVHCAVFFTITEKIVPSKSFTGGVTIK